MKDKKFKGVLFMKNERKFLEFIDQHKVEILILLGTGVSILLWGKYVKALKHAYSVGVGDGFHLTMDWFDENMGTELLKMYTEYAKNNPEKIVHFK